LQVLMQHNYTGNVRELSNAMEYAWIISGGQPITADHLPRDMTSPKPSVAIPMGYPVGSGTSSVATPPSGHSSAGYAVAGPASATTPTIPFPNLGGLSPPTIDPNAPTKSLADVEMEYILHVYAKNGMNKQKTSDELGISLKTLYNKLHKYEEERQRRAG